MSPRTSRTSVLIERGRELQRLKYSEGRRCEEIQGDTHTEGNAT